MIIYSRIIFIYKIRKLVQKNDWLLQIYIFYVPAKNAIFSDDLPSAHLVLNKCEKRGGGYNIYISYYLQ